LFDHGGNLCRLTTDRGETFTSRFIVLATGPISKPSCPIFRASIPSAASTPTQHFGQRTSRTSPT